MQLLVEVIKCEGRVFLGGFFKVDGLVNYQFYFVLICEMGEMFVWYFVLFVLIKVLIIEVSGIVLVIMIVVEFGVLMVYVCKKKLLIMSEQVYMVQLVSCIKGGMVDFFVSFEYLGLQDCVVVIDDFFVLGGILCLFSQIIVDSGVILFGFGCVIEKEFEGGCQYFVDLNVLIYIFVNIVWMSEEEGIVVQVGC